MEPLVVPAAAAILLAGLLVGWALVRSWRPSRSRRPRADVPGTWRALIESRVPLTRALTVEEWDDTLRRMKKKARLDGPGIQAVRAYVLAAREVPTPTTTGTTP